jgi:hypothetical protein
MIEAFFIVEVPKALSSQFMQCGYLVVGHSNSSLHYHVCLAEMQKGATHLVLQGVCS